MIDLPQAAIDGMDDTLSVHTPPHLRGNRPPMPSEYSGVARTLRDVLDQKASNPKDSIGDTKAPLWLLSPIAKVHWALGQFAGMCKYGAWNWRVAGVRTSVYLSAMDRHLSAYLSGERLDPVDGTHHLGNVMACAAILLDAEAAGKLIDDRPPSVDLRPAFNEVQATMAVLRAKYEHLTPKHYTKGDTQ